MSITGSDVDGDVDAKRVPMKATMAAMAMVAKESDGLGHRRKEYGASGGGFARIGWGARLVGGLTSS